jgi:uroporphyrinogen decarboxylase
MNKRERVLTVLNGMIPDKVPKGDILFHQKTIFETLGLKKLDKYKNPAALMAFEDMEEEEFERQKKFREIINCDLVGIWPNLNSGTLNRADESIIKDIFGNIYTIYENSFKLDHIIKSPGDMDDYCHPDVNDISYKNFELWHKNSGFCIFAVTDSAIWGVLHNLTGFENFMVWLYTEKERMLQLMKRHVAFNIELAKKSYEHGIDAVWIGDDFASNSGTFLKPEDMSKYYFPILKWQVSEIKKALDVPVVFHSDGNLNDIMDSLIETGVDAVMSLQPSCGMDIKFIKEKYGEKITLWGNINISKLLEFGTPEEIKTVVKETIKIAAPGGKYILSTSNAPSLPSIPTGNILAMYEAGEEYGYYPIDYEVDSSLYRKYIKN